MLHVKPEVGSAILCGRAEAGATDFADRSTRLSILIILLLVLAAMALKSYLWLHVPIGYDEFNCLRQVHAFQRDELTQPFQSLHVHLFSWLGGIYANEITQAMAARSAMLSLLAGTCACLFLIGRHLLGLLGALCAVLCYVSFSHTIRNGASFRPDTPATFLFMVALYLFVVKKDSVAASIGAGVAMAVSCLFTIKASLYFGAFAAVTLTWLLPPGSRLRAVKRTFFFAVSFVLGFLLLYRVHAAAFPPSESGQETQYLQRAFSTFMFFRFYPEPSFLVPTLKYEPLVWLLLVTGFAGCVHRVITGRGRDRENAAYLLAMSVPLVSLAFFRNTAGYFYVFILPSAILLCGYGVGMLKARLNPRMVPLGMALIGVIVFSSFRVWPFVSRQAAETTAAQHELLSVVHRAFPDPVPYIDGCGMAASYPNASFFMSSAVMTPYLRAGIPVLRNALVEKKPLFLLANVPHLDLHAGQPPKSYAGLRLLQEDWTALRSYFVHHWGPLWVAGKQFDLKQGTPAQSFEIVTAGAYTVEAAAEISIDGAAYRDGDVLELEQGVHTIDCRGADANVTLRWGDHLYRPEEDGGAGRLFMGDLG